VAAPQEVLWKAQIATEVAPLDDQVFLVGHSLGGSILIAHLALYAAKLPQATIRTFDGRGHQFGNDLADVAAEIRREETRQDDNIDIQAPQQ
jgi:hypothetical protein